MSQALLSIRAKCETNRVTGTRHFSPSLCSSAEGNEGGGRLDACGLKRKRNVFFQARGQRVITQ